MRHYLRLIPLLLFFQVSFGQYTEVINSKRPGFSDSPYSLGTGVYQIEGGIYYKKVGNYLYWDHINDNSVNYNSKSFGTDLTFRTTQFFERLEFDIDVNLQNEKRNYTHPAVFSDSGFGLSRLTIGAKYLVYMPIYTDKSKEIHSWVARHSFDKKRLIPAVGVYAGLNTNLLNKLYKNPDGISPRFAIYTQNDLSEKLVVLTNFIMDKAFTNDAENSFISTVTYAFNERLSTFGEIQAFFRKNVPNDVQFGAGGAYLVNNNLQVDLSARMIYDERGDHSFLFGSGVSWRLDKHKDKILIKKTDNNEAQLPKEKKGFFNKITFGIFAGNKVKKNHKGKPPKIKTPKAKERTLEPPVNKKAQKAKKKRNKKLIKQQNKKEKALKKYNKKQKKSEDKS